METRGRKEIAMDGENTRFKKGNKASVGKGRPENKFKHLKNKFSLSADDVTAIIENQLSLSAQELKAIIQNPKSTVIEMSYASALLQSIKHGDLSSIETLLNRNKNIGRPKEKVELAGADGKPIDAVINVIGVKPNNKELSPQESTPEQ